jgi:hypothetical protein
VQELLVLLADVGRVPPPQWEAEVLRRALLRFGEIAFCAISGNEQLKGYGSILMNQLKRHVQKDSKCNP